MCRAIEHRGPDDQGILAGKGIGLGMRRLSIIDVAGGHQPIHNEDRSIWIVFNGEIYNFLELRQELLKAGHHFYTNSDTEVIVHAYEEYGENCPTKLRGMFAFAIYDERRQVLLLARDRLGKKPLHYALSNGRLLFASEIKSLLAVAPELGEVDADAVLQYFYFGYVPDPLTAFSGIKKLPPGHLLLFRNGGADVRPYWNLPQPNPHTARISEDEYLGELESRLTEAVKIRLISEVPLGALLSGGVDSSLVVALMARASSRPVKTFSAAFRNQEFNESEHAQLVAKTFGTEHHELVIEPDFWNTVSKLTAHMEEPFADSSLLPTYYISALARQHVTVALSGDGGDEVFAGYDRYAKYLHRQDHFRWFPRSLGQFYRDQVFPLLPSGFRGRNLIYNYSLTGAERYCDSVTYLPVLERERCLFSRDYLGWAETRTSPLEVFNSYLAETTDADDLIRLQYLDIKTYLAGDILTKVDRMSMAASLEMRSPLLDHEIVEWGISLPAEMKIHGTESKYILKRLAERIGVPREVLHRPKRGFSLPLPEWMRGHLKGQLIEILTEPRTVQRGYLNPRSVSDLIQEHVSGRRNHSGVLWQMLMLEMWFRNFVEKPQRSATSSSKPAAGATRHTVEAR